MPSAESSALGVAPTPAVTRLAWMVEQQDVERWFIRQGLPHLIHGYRASTDVFTRALPFLLAVFLFDVIGAYSDRFKGWSQAMVTAISFLIILAAAIAVNLLRGRRPLQRPDHVGPLELAVFTIVPAIPALLFGNRPLLAAAGIIALNLAILAIVYFVVGFGLVPTTVWAARQTYRHLSQLLTLMGRALPLVLVFSAFLFLNAELWQVAHGFTALAFWVTVGLLASVAAGFVGLRIPREIAQISTFAGWSDVCELAAQSDSPLARRETQDLTGDCDPPLSKADRFNVGLVVLFNLGLQIVLVSVVIGIFYLAFGIMAVREETIIDWTTLEQLGSDDVLGRWDFFGTDLVLSVPLMRVVGFLVAFSALQFAVAAVTDATYRQEFFDEVTTEVRHALAVRAIYLNELLGEDAPRN